MREYVIYTDSCADLDAALVEELELVYHPLVFTLDGTPCTDWPDGRDISPEEFYRKLRAGSTSSTSQITPTQFADAFRPLVAGGKDILYLAFSSGLSGTVDAARLAAQELKEEFPKANIRVVDTLAASLGQGLLVWHAVQKKRAGKSLDEVAAWVEGNRLKLAHWFTVDDLDFLKRGGRLSGAAAFLGGMLHVKPVLHVNNEGHLVPVEKVRGRRQSLDALVGHMKKTAIDPASQTVFVSHGDAPDEAQYVSDEVRRRLGVNDLYINHIGPVIGSHSGPGTIALFFFARER